LDFMTSKESELTNKLLTPQPQPTHLLLLSLLQPTPPTHLLLPSPPQPTLPTPVL
jgi:hypothetical protein